MGNFIFWVSVIFSIAMFGFFLYDIRRSKQFTKADALALLAVCTGIAVSSNYTPPDKPQLTLQATSTAIIITPIPSVTAPFLPTITATTTILTPTVATVIQQAPKTNYELFVETESQGSCLEVSYPCTYTVVRGDFYEELARNFYEDGFLANKIYYFNRDDNGLLQTLHPGQQILIPNPDAMPILPYFPCEDGMPPCMHSIQSNESYGSISQFYFGTTLNIDAIRGANSAMVFELEPPGMQVLPKELQPGDTLVIPRIEN